MNPYSFEWQFNAIILFWNIPNFLMHKNRHSEWNIFSWMYGFIVYVKYEDLCSFCHSKIPKDTRSNIQFRGDKTKRHQTLYAKMALSTLIEVAKSSAQTFPPFNVLLKNRYQNANTQGEYVCENHHARDMDVMGMWMWCDVVFRVVCLSLSLFASLFFNFVLAFVSG